MGLDRTNDRSARTIELEGCSRTAMANFDFGSCGARRNVTEPQLDVLSNGALTLNLGARVARLSNEPIAFTARELAFLEVFMRNPGRTLTRPVLEDALWDHDRDTTSNLVDVYIGRLRAKLARAGERSMLETVRGIGYRLRADASA